MASCCDDWYWIFGTSCFIGFDDLVTGYIILLKFSFLNRFLGSFTRIRNWEISPVVSCFVSCIYSFVLSFEKENFSQGVYKMNFQSLYLRISKRFAHKFFMDFEIVVEINIEVHETRSVMKVERGVHVKLLIRNLTIAMNQPIMIFELDEVE